MTTQSTIDKLIEMRLTSMSDAFRTQMEDPRMKGIPFEDRFGMLVDIEYSNRKSNSLKRLIHNAGFDQPDAYIGDINYTSGRKLNRSLIERLATCEYITEHRNLFITGALLGAGRPIWHAHSGWKPANSVTRRSMFACRICSWNWRWLVMTAHTKRSKENTPTRFC